MASLDDLAALDAIAQAELVRRKEVTAAELVEAAIARIERVNPAINAVVIPMFEEARAAARQPLPDGPLSGVPFLLKDLAAEYAGAPFNEASRFLQGYVPAEDQELVRRNRRAGLIVVGKTNTPELGLGPTTEPHLYGPTRNPWDVTRTAGGSSGGSGAAVAAGLVPWPTATTPADPSACPRRAAASSASSPRAGATRWARTTAT
jgi:amidase